MAKLRCRGLTIIELMIYTALVTIVSIPLITVTLASSRSSSEGSMFVKIQERNRSVIQRLVEEYRSSLSGTTSVTSGGKVLRFTTDGGFDGANTIAGPVIRYEIQIGAGETVNGTDDNGNGLSDEAILVRINEATAEQLTLASSLSYPASSFTQVGAGVTVKVVTMGFSYGTRKVSQVQNGCTVYPQN